MATSTARLSWCCASLLLVAALSAGVFGAAAPLPSADLEALEGRAPTAEELQPSVEAAFPRESYRPGSDASLVVYNAAAGLRLQVFRVGPERVQTVGNDEMQGVPATRERF